MSILLKIIWNTEKILRTKILQCICNREIRKMNDYTEMSKNIACENQEIHLTKVCLWRVCNNIKNYIINYFVILKERNRHSAGMVQVNNAHTVVWITIEEFSDEDILISVGVTGKLVSPLICREILSWLSGLSPGRRGKHLMFTVLVTKQVCSLTSGMACACSVMSSCLRSHGL